MTGGARRVHVSAEDSIKEERSAQEDSVDILWRIVDRIYVMEEEKCPQLIIHVLLWLLSRPNLAKPYRQSDTG